MSGKCYTFYGENGSFQAQRSSPILFFYFIELIVIITLNGLSFMRARRAQQRWEQSGWIEESKPTPVLLPVYTRLMWITSISLGISISVQFALPYSIFHTNGVLAAVCEAMSAFFRQLPFDALTFSLMSQGAGRQTYVSALKKAALMGLINMGCRFLYVLFIDDGGEGQVSVFFASTSCFIYIIFYFIVWLLPSSVRLARRPAVRPYAAYWAFYFSFYYIAMEMRFQGLDFAMCFSFVVTILFYLLSPIALYRACSNDSLYWLGAVGAAARLGLHPDRASVEIDPATGQRVATVVGENPMAPSVAATVAQADSLGLPLVNFNALSIDVEGPDDLGAAPAELHALAAGNAEASHGGAPDAHALVHAHKKVPVGVLKLLGQGSFARVYKGRYKNEAVAIKLIYAMELTTGLVRNLYREAVTLGALRSRYVVGVEGICVMPPAVAMVMELCAGSLFNMIHGQGEAALEAIDAKVSDYEAHRRARAQAAAEAKSRWRLFTAAKKNRGVQRDAGAPTDRADVVIDRNHRRESDGGHDSADGGQDAHRDSLRRPTPRAPRGVMRERDQASHEHSRSHAPERVDQHAELTSEEDGAGATPAAACDGSTQLAGLPSHLPADVTAALRAVSSAPAGAAAFCKPALSLRTQVRLALDCCAGVTFLHTRTRPVVHLDIKSGNFLIGRDGVVKIADMELSTRLLAAETLNAPMPASACRDESNITVAAAAAAVDPFAASDVGAVAGREPSSFGIIARVSAAGPRSTGASPFVGPMCAAAAPLAADISGSAMYGLARAGSQSGAGAVGSTTALLPGTLLTQTVKHPLSAASATAPATLPSAAGVGDDPPTSARSSPAPERTQPRDDGYAFSGLTLPPARTWAPRRTRHLLLHGHPAFAPDWVRHGRVAALAAGAATATAREDAVPVAGTARHSALGESADGGTTDMAVLALQSRAGKAASSTSSLAPATHAGTPSNVGDPSRDAGSVPREASRRGLGPLFFAHGEWGPWPTPSLALAQLSAPVRAAVLLLNRENRYSNLGADGFLVDEDGAVLPLSVSTPPREANSSAVGQDRVSGDACTDAPGSSGRQLRTLRFHPTSGDPDAGDADADNGDGIAEPGATGRPFAAPVLTSSSLPSGVAAAHRASADPLHPAGARSPQQQPMPITAAADGVGHSAGKYESGAAAHGRLPRGPSAPLPPPAEPPRAEPPLDGSPQPVEVAVSSTHSGFAGSWPPSPRNMSRRHTDLHASRVGVTQTARHGDADRYSAHGASAGSNDFVINTGGFRAEPTDTSGCPAFGEARSCIRSYCTLASVKVFYCDYCMWSSDGEARGGICGGVADGDEGLAHAGLELALEDSDDEENGDAGGGDSGGGEHAHGDTRGTNGNLTMAASSSGSTLASRSCCASAAASARRSARQTLRQRYERRMRQQLGKRQRVLAIPEAVNWLAPEFMRMEPFGTAADVYSLACVLWEIVAREVPFQELTDMLEAEQNAADAAAEEARKARNAELKAEIRRKRDAEASVVSPASTVASHDDAAPAYADTVESASRPDAALTTHAHAPRHIVLDVAGEPADSARTTDTQVSLAAQDMVRIVNATPASVRRVLNASNGHILAPNSISEVGRILSGSVNEAQQAAASLASPPRAPRQGSGRSPVVLNDITPDGPATLAGLASPADHASARTVVAGEPLSLPPALWDSDSLPAASELAPLRINVSGQTAEEAIMPNEVGDSFSGAQASLQQSQSHTPPPSRLPSSFSLPTEQDAATAAQQRAQPTRAFLTAPGVAVTAMRVGRAGGASASPISDAAAQAPVNLTVPRAFADGPPPAVVVSCTVIPNHAASSAAGSLSPPQTHSASISLTSSGGKCSPSPLPPPPAPFAPEVELIVPVIAAPGPAAPSTGTEHVQACADGASVTEPAPQQRHPVTEIMHELIAYGHYRPPVPAHTHPVLAELIIQGWHPEPSLRPTALEMHRRLLELYETLN
jgi:serine/threonine protein kinase